MYKRVFASNALYFLSVSMSKSAGFIPVPSLNKKYARLWCKPIESAHATTEYTWPKIACSMFILLEVKLI